MGYWPEAKCPADAGKLLMASFCGYVSSLTISSSLLLKGFNFVQKKQLKKKVNFFIEKKISVFHDQNHPTAE